MEPSPQFALRTVMTRHFERSFLPAIALFCFSCFITMPATAASPGHWVGTWSTSPVAASNPTAKFGAEGATGTTLREIVHISFGGDSIRVILTNEFGLDSLNIGAAQIALSSGASGITGTGTPLTFGGQTSVIIPRGAVMVSDPINLKVAP